jgi:hypothetical protein
MVLFRIKETEIVDVVVIKYGLRGWEGVRGDLKVRERGGWFQARDQSGWRFTAK